MSPRKNPAAPSIGPSSPPDPYEEGALFALRMLMDVVEEQRQGAHLIERLLADAPKERKQTISDLLRPMSAQLQAAETIYTRVENRTSKHLRERWRAQRSEAAREGGE